MKKIKYRYPVDPVNTKKILLNQNYKIDENFINKNKIINLSTSLGSARRELKGFERIPLDNLDADDDKILTCGRFTGLKFRNGKTEKFLERKSFKKAFKIEEKFINILLIK